MHNVSLGMPKTPIALPDQSTLRTVFDHGADGVLRWKVDRGTRVKAGAIAGCIWTSKGCSYVQVRFDGKLYFAHRLIWAMHHGEPDPSMVIDHIDGNGTNNSLSNLRLVHQTLNARNSKRHKSSTTIANGVYRSREKWAARILDDHGSMRTIGTFADPADAVAARKHAEQQRNYTDRHGSVSTNESSAMKPRVTGVFWDARYRKWQVRLTRNGKIFFGGRHFCFGAAVRRRMEIDRATTD